MPATIIGNPAVVTGLYQAFNGKAAGYNVYTNNLAYAAQNGPAAYAAEIGKGFANVPAATLAASVLTNVGIVNATLQDALVQIFTAYPASARGQIVLNLVNLLTNLEGDAVYGAAATNWNKTVADNNAYSSNPTNVVDTVVDASSVTLSAGADVLTAKIFNAVQVYTPGGDDRINSLQNDDVLTGTGAGSRLDATLGNAGDNGANRITPTMTNIETINARFDSNVAMILDLQDTTGTKAVNVTRINTGVNATVDNITEGTTNDLSVKNSQNPVNNVSFNYLDAALVGTADAVSLEVSNVVTNTLAVQSITGNTAASQGFESMALTASGSPSTIGDLQAHGLKTLTIDGTATSLTLNNVTTANVGGATLSKIDASAFDGNLSINLTGVLNAQTKGTSGVDIAVNVLTGKGNDTLRLTDDSIGANDTVNAGEGTDTLAFTAGATRILAAAPGAGVTNVEGVEAITVTRSNSTLGADVLTVNMDRVTGDQTTTLTNASATAADGNVTFNLLNAGAVEAMGVTLRHSSTGNNNINQNTVNLDVAAGVTTAGLTIADGNNTDMRFNFILAADSDVAVSATSAITNLGNTTNTVANVTLTDNDSEDNTVALAEVARHFGTVTVAGSSAKTLNLDTTTTGANGGLFGRDVSGAAVDLVGVRELSATVGQVKFVGANFDSSTYAGNVILRVDTARTATGETATGGQNIKFGDGNDVVVFDKINDNRAGLTISDTVAGGNGLDTLVIDGQNVRVSLGASEWTNVTGFETIHLLANGAAALSSRLGQNSYNLTLTNELVANNGVNGLINIVSDNDSANDVAGVLDTAGTAQEGGATIDARALNANAHFSFNGEEGGTAVADRFVFADANINGANIIDGGAADNLAATGAANADVIEVRNSAVVSVGDLANIKNVGTIAFANDQAVAQNAVLELNDTVLDALVDSYHTATVTDRETLTVRTNDLVNDLPGAISNTALDLDMSAVTSKFIVNVTLGQIGATVAVDNIKLGTGGGLVTATGFDTTGTVLLGTADGITVSASQFGLTAAAGNYVASAGGIVFGALGTGVATDRLYIVEGAALGGFGGAGNDIGIYYDADGSGAGAAVLIGVLVDTAAAVLSGAGNSGITVVA
ncbi:MAG: hypothetical protein I8H67_01005 [Comamonadaceae bacterium]|nr:hypothetical protein [Comamonadaceae bacterium]